MAKEDGITRRDFLEGVLVAAGGAAVLGFSPLRALANYPGGVVWPSDGDIGVDSRVLRGGNLRDTFTPAHWLRDDRLVWGADRVRLIHSDVDGMAGNFSVLPDTGTYDLIVVGGGISGLATAFFALKQKPTAKILILENNPRLGGVSSRDDASPVLPTHASAAAAYAAYPYAQFLFDFYDGCGVEWRDNILTLPDYNYYFDSFMPAASRSVWNGTTKWVPNVYTSQGIDNIPFTAPVRQDLHQARQDFRNWYNTAGSPTDPPDDSDPKYDYLAHKSLREYLTVDRAFHPAVAEFYDQYASDALACFTPYANAYTGISFLGAEYFDQFLFPGGNSYIARRALKKMIPASITGTTYDEILNNPINTAELDKTTNQVRYRMVANALRVDTGSAGATVRYHLGGEFYQATCRAVVLAGQMHTAHKLTEHLMSSEQLQAADKYQHIPIPIANVAVKNSQFLVNAGSAYDYYWYGSRHWQDAIMADWPKVMNDPAKKNDGTRPNVLTFYSGYFFDPNTTRQEERVKMLSTPFGDYETSLRDDMTRVFGPYGFDWNRDVSAVYLYRWGHGMVVPYVGWTFGVPITGPGGQVQRTEGPRTIARKQIGRVSFGAQDSEGAPAIEDAIWAGKRTSEEVLSFL